MNPRFWLVGLPLVLAVPACQGDDRALHFAVSLERAPGAILSFWGASASETFAAGGTLAADGGQGFVWRYDGNTWVRTDLPTSTLWWIHGLSLTDVWAVGEHGTVVHFDGIAWQVVESGRDYTLWGIWGPSPSQLWAVGGSVLGGRPGVLRRWDGSTWADESGIDTTGDLFFKVWGTGADDVHVVGDHGTALHWDGQAWTRTTAAPGRLLTVRGRGAADVFAVGGLAEGIVVHGDGTGAWSGVDIGQVPGLMGLWTGPGQPVLATGFRGLMLLGDGSGWRVQDPVTSLCLHAAWSDGQGTWFAGGGDLFSPGTPGGVILVGHGKPRP